MLKADREKKALMTIRFLEIARRPRKVVHQNLLEMSLQKKSSLRYRQETISH
jgi:hypothetical protein